LLLILIFSQDKQLLRTAFPSLFEGLTPLAAAHGLQPLKLSETCKVEVLGTQHHAETVLSVLLEPLDQNPEASACISLDAEWNVSRTVGVSNIVIAPHSYPNSIYIIPVCFM
jgi:hypothetical protein